MLAVLIIITMSKIDVNGKAIGESECGRQEPFGSTENHARPKGSVEMGCQ